MTDEQTSPKRGMEPAPKPGSSFLGGGPKFNQAGYNAPLPGERVADVLPQPKQNLRIWIGVALGVVLVIALYALYLHQPGSHNTGRGGVSINDRPTDNPDAPPSASADDGQ